MAIQAISFGKPDVTERGNKYERTNVGGMTGMAVGGAFSAYKFTSNVMARNKLINDPVARQRMVDSLNNILGNNVITSEEYLKSLRASTKASIAMNVLMTALTVGLGLGLGKFVDKIVNSNREKSADREVRLAATEKNSINDLKG